MDELKTCPICGSKLTIHGPEDWKPTFYDHDSGGDPYNAVCDCGFQFSIGYCEYDEFIKALNRRPAPENKPLTLEQLTLDQLRQMDGEPVWWWNKSHAPVCTICIARLNEVSFVDFDYSHDDSTGIVKYERWVKWGFKPYARKPEQEEK